MKARIYSALLVLLVCNTGWAMTQVERKAYLDKFLQTLPQVASFNEWLQRTGELPPDFDALPKNNGLPDPLTFLDGKAVKTAADWEARRTEIIKLLEKYEIGTMPPNT